MMTRKKSFYTPEFKMQAISLVREANRSASEVAIELGINVNTLYSWLISATYTAIKILLMTILLQKISV
jgi:transposase-like protein